MAEGLKGFVVLVVTLSVADSAYGKISDSVIERDGRGIILLAEPFGFGTEGHLDMTVSNLELHRSNVDTALQGFFITSTQVLAPNVVPWECYSLLTESLSCFEGNVHHGCCILLLC